MSAEPDYSAIQYRVHQWPVLPEDQDRGEIVRRGDGTYWVRPRPLTAAQKLERQRAETEVERQRQRAAATLRTEWPLDTPSLIHRPPGSE